ncbi:protein SCO1/2 [Rudaeicoccus suwonensis]|uniref:Protein SCO1/2 n=2 Tax=Rudaeicoccus suwonensis TaxID=657409 RepID=A0A561EC81_9MICO|nr:protein SCO1/2 [Rudaeicoccus suwonensis]
MPANILDLQFTTSTGQHTSLAALKGKTVVLQDIMTLCQETCPIDTATLVSTDRAEVAAGRSKNEVFVSLTVDPVRDTVPQIAAYRALYAPPPANWQVWTGSQASVNAIWNFLGVWRQKVADDPGTPPRNWRTGQPLTYDVQHSDEVFFIDPQQRERFLLEGTPYATKGQVPKAMYDFMDADGRKNLTSPDPSAWTQAQAQKVLAWIDG